MTDTTDAALDALVAKMGTQIGDDVAVIYDHECLFIQARAAITALRAENAALRAQIAEAEARGRIAGLKEAVGKIPNGWMGEPYGSNMEYGPSTSVKAKAAIRALIAQAEKGGQE